MLNYSHMKKDTKLKLHDLLPKELIVTTLFLLFALLSFSQYFNDAISTPSQHEQTIAFDYSGEFLTSAGIMSDSNWYQSGWNNIHFKQYDDDFNIIRETTYHDSTNAFAYGYDLCYLDNHYYFSGYKSGLYFQGNDTSYVIKFDTVGNPVWIKNYFSSILNSRISLLKKTGDDIIVAGTHNYEPDSVVQHSFVAKIDSSGTLIWSKTFDESDNSTVIDIEVLSSGELLVNLSFMYGPQNFKTKLYKLSSSGDILWHNTFGINGAWLHSIAATMEMPDGSLFCYGGISDPNGAEFERSWLFKLDNNGSVIKDTIYKLSLNNDWFEPSYSKPIIKSDEIFLLGHYREDGAAQKQSYLASVDFDLNLKWVRMYGDYLRRNELSFLHDLNNGYYLMAGHIYNEIPSSPIIDEWFMVVDSLGCDVADCSVGLDQIENKEDGFTISPNPANNEVSISTEKSLLGKNTIRYQIIDSFGKIQEEKDLKTPIINISKLQPGVYFIRLKDQNTYLGTKRLIIQ